MLKIIFYLSILLPLVSTRGPHHPRGQKVVQHHVHYRPTRNTKNENEQSDVKLTQDTSLLHDTQHIREDLGEWVAEKDLSSLTDEELEFHYFKLHDFDNNTKLDGLEILKAIQHTIAHSDDIDDEEYDFEYFVELIDQVLVEDDLDSDGFLSYPEYVMGRAKDGREKHLYNSPSKPKPEEPTTIFNE